MSPGDMNPDEGFEEALDDLDFDRARRLADQAGGERKKELVERIRTGHAQATDRAEKLAARIQSLARADHYEGLLALAADPSTAPLLALVSTELRRGAMLHLDGAVRRQQRFRAAGRRHMKAASEALVLLDTGKALSELGKADPRWLTESQRDELGKLRTQTEQAVAERLELEERTAAVLREHAPDTRTGPSPAPRTSRTSRIWRIGCLGSVLTAVAILFTALVALVSRRPRR